MFLLVSVSPTAFPLSVSFPVSFLDCSPRHAYLVVAKNRPCHGHRRHFKKLKPHRRPDDELRTKPTNERISASSRYRHWPVAPSREHISLSAPPPVASCKLCFRSRSVGTCEIHREFSSWILIDRSTLLFRSSQLESFSFFNLFQISNYIIWKIKRWYRNDFYSLSFFYRTFRKTRGLTNCWFHRTQAAYYDSGEFLDVIDTKFILYYTIDTSGDIYSKITLHAIEVWHIFIN